MWPLKSLSLKITFSILFAVLLIFAAILLYNYHISHDLLLKNVESNVKNLAYGKALRIEKLLEASAKIPENMSFILESSDYSKEELQELLELIVANNEEIFGSCIAYEPFAFDPDSMFFAPYVFRSAEGVSFKYLNAESLNYFELDWYSLPCESKQACWTEPYFDEGGGEVLMCTYSVPFFANKLDKEIKGVVTIDISLEWLKDYVESIKVYEKGYAFLISGQGTVITHPVEDLSTSQNIFQVAEERGYDILARAAEDMVQGGSDFIPYESPLVSGKTWLYYTPLKSAGWSLAIILPEEEFTADLYKLNRDLLLIGIAGFIILFLIVIIISRKITKPLTVLALAAREIGGGNFEAMLPESKSKDEIGALNASISSMQTELKTYIRNLKETTAAKEKIESELQIARDIQQSIIPHIFPPFPENDNVELYAALNPARDVGGDLYDFFFVDEKHLCFTVGDVSGKGVPASLFMAITRTLLRARISVNMKANEIMTAMNKELCLENENAMFVTLFLGILNVETGHISYCNAGHNYPFIMKDNGDVMELKGTHGTPLGAIPDIEYGISEVFFDHRDSMMIYTDGISEAIDVNEKQYTEKRIIDQLSKMQGSKPETVTRELLLDLEGFVGEADQFDDITMLVIKWVDTLKDE
jgi:sigma-B regulation protein RsbU (phosphoserine phosphatase)